MPYCSLHAWLTMTGATRFTDHIRPMLLYVCIASAKGLYCYSQFCIMQRDSTVQSASSALPHMMAIGQLLVCVNPLTLKHVPHKPSWGLCRWLVTTAHIQVTHVSDNIMSIHHSSSQSLFLQLSSTAAQVACYLMVPCSLAKQYMTSPASCLTADSILAARCTADAASSRLLRTASSDVVPPLLAEQCTAACSRQLLITLTARQLPIAASNGIVCSGYVEDTGRSI